MKNFVDLKNYLIKEIKPQENYQYFIFKELINSGGQISYDELANRYDAEYENANKTDTRTILRDAPTSALSRHGYITSDKNNVYSNFNEEPLYYKDTISWILEKSLDHWAKNKSIKGLEFREGVIKTDREIEKFCYENNIPRNLVENIILSINRGEKQIILDGPPGTGKTYLIKKIVQFLSSEDSIYDLVQFHPSYGYEEFVEGLRPTTKDASLSFEVVSGKLLDLVNKTKSSYPINQTPNSPVKEDLNLIPGSKSSFYFVAQGGSYEVAKESSNIWAPNKNARGSEQVDWNLLKQLKTGDLIIHYSTNHIRAIGKVTDFPQENVQRPYSNDDIKNRENTTYLSWENKDDTLGTLVEVDYFELKKPINKNEFCGNQTINENKITKNSAFDKNGNVSQKYLSSLSSNFMDFLKEGFNEIGELVEKSFPHSELIEEGTISRSGEIILQALRNLGGKAKLKDIYKQVNLIDENIPESSVRRDLQKYSHGSKYYGNKFPEIFKNISSGVWEIVDSTNSNIAIEKDSLHNKGEKTESFGSHDFLIIDEINRGNLPKIFGELLNAFEYRDENISLQYSDKPLSVPSNLIFLGTMNSTDKSVGRMDAALRRRFDFIHVEPNYEVLEKYYENKELLVPNLIEGLEILNELLEKDLGKHCLIGHTFFMKNHDSPFTYDDIKKIWNRKIYPLLEEYFLDDITKLEKYKTYKYFWEEVEPVESNKKSNNRYSKELLSKHLLEISNEHKELQLAVEKWGEDIENMNIWPGYINTNFRSGGRTLIFTANSNGLSERDGKYHLFKLAGNGNIVLPLYTLYSNDFNRAPFNSREFQEVFEKKLIDYFQKFNLKINAEKFFSKSKPSFEMQEIIKTKSIEDFLDIWDWVIEEINNTGIRYE